MVQTDCGTENGEIAAARSYFRADATDYYGGEKAHRYGDSKRNCRKHSGLAFDEADHPDGSTC